MLHREISEREMKKEKRITSRQKKYCKKEKKKTAAVGRGGKGLKDGGRMRQSEQPGASIRWLNRAI